MNLFDFLEDSFLKGDVKDELFVDHNYGDIITVSPPPSLPHGDPVRGFPHAPVHPAPRLARLATERVSVFTDLTLPRFLRPVEEILSFSYELFARVICRRLRKLSH